MRKLLIPAIILALAALALAQEPESKWEAGTILNIAQHDPAQDAQGMYLYDMTLQVRDQVYVVLFKLSLETDLGTYKNGIEVTVLVGDRSMKVNDVMGRTQDCPILKVSPAPKGK